MKTLSDSEVEYVVRSCALGMRNDGRSPVDYRNILVESDIFPHCAGSSRVTIGSAVDVICGVKVRRLFLYLELVNTRFQVMLLCWLQVVVGEAGSDDNEYVHTSVEFSPSCNLKMDDKATTKYSSHIAEIIKSYVKIGILGMTATPRSRSTRRTTHEMFSCSLVFLLFVVTTGRSSTTARSISPTSSLFLESFIGEST